VRENIPVDVPEQFELMWKDLNRGDEMLDVEQPIPNPASSSCAVDGIDFAGDSCLVVGIGTEGGWVGVENHLSNREVESRAPGIELDESLARDDSDQVAESMARVYEVHELFAKGDSTQVQLMGKGILESLIQDDSTQGGAAMAQGVNEKNAMVDSTQRGKKGDEARTLDGSTQEAENNRFLVSAAIVKQEMTFF
jgi:hypothetical protein